MYVDGHRFRKHVLTLSVEYFADGGCVVDTVAHPMSTFTMLSPVGILNFRVYQSCAMNSETLFVGPVHVNCDIAMHVTGIMRALK